LTPRLIERLADSPDLLLRRLIARLGYEEGARQYLERLRWPGGTRCPRCDGASVLRLQARRKYHCATCKYQFRVTAGTRLHDSHVPGWKWLVAVEMMMSSAEPLTAAELREAMGGSFKTAWFLLHRIREALTTEADHSVAGVPRRRTSRKYRGAYWAEARWRASSGKQAERFRFIVLALIEAEPLEYRDLIERSAGPAPRLTTRACTSSGSR
jgi:transposase-like protein